jgi:hypothetical protein
MSSGLLIIPSFAAHDPGFSVLCLHSTEFSRVLPYSALSSISHALARMSAHASAEVLRWTSSDVIKWLKASDLSPQLIASVAADPRKLLASMRRIR